MSATIGKWELEAQPENENDQLQKKLQKILPPRFYKKIRPAAYSIKSG